MKKLTSNNEVHSLIVGYSGAGCALLALVLALFSLCESKKANELSGEVFKWQKLQQDKQEATNLSIAAEWQLDSVYISQFRETVFQSKEGSAKVYAGFCPYLTVKIHNQSMHAVWIERVKCTYMQNGFFSSEFSSTSIFKRDFIDPIALPVSLDKEEQKWILARLPIPLSEKMSQDLSGLAVGRLFSSKEVMEEYNRHSSSIHDLGDKPTYVLERLFYGEFLPPAVDTGRVQHVLRVEVRTASGMSFVKDFEFVDAIRPLVTQYGDGRIEFYDK